MGSEVDGVTKGELDDSGCVQDDTTQNSELSLMDMPDDILLHILKFCSAPERKALAYCCTRLCRMAQERMLWRAVDARAEKCSRARLRWYLDNVLLEDTRVLLLSGFAKDMEGCLGFMNMTREEGEKAKCSDSNWDTVEHLAQQLPAGASAAQQRKIFAPKCNGRPTWSDNELGRGGAQPCTGPQFSLSQELLRQLEATCPQLSTLALEYCNIDCRDTNLGHFPSTLKKLSLRGCRCYNMVMDKTFLFRVNCFLPNLQSLDISECEWLDPATLLPLSKLPELTELRMRDCAKLTEFVAYASLTARYGFKALKSLDLRGSPVGDSEVSALGWLPRLERLWLARTPATCAPAAHAHYLDDPAVKHVQLHPWEEMEPHLLRERPNPTYYYYDDVAMEITEREREGLKRKPEEIENEKVERSPKRVREDVCGKWGDDFIHLRSKHIKHLKNKLKRKLLEQNNVDDDASTSRDNDAGNDKANESNENDAEVKDLGEGRREAEEPSSKDCLKKNGTTKHDSQNAQSSDDNHDDGDDDDDDIDHDLNPIKVKEEPEKTLVIEINLKEGTQTRSFVNLNAPGSSAGNSNGFREIGESSKSANCNEASSASAEKSVEETAEIPNVIDGNVRLADLLDDDVEIPNVVDENEELANLLDANVEIPNMVDANVTLANLLDVNVEIPNVVDGNVRLANPLDDNVEIPNVVDANVTLANLLGDNVEIPNVVDGNVRLANLLDDNVEIPNVVDGNVRLANLLDDNVEIPNVVDGNVRLANLLDDNVEIPNLGNYNRDDPPIQNQNNAANGAQPNPVRNGNFVDSLRIDRIVNFGEMGGDDHGELIVFTSTKRTKMYPTYPEGVQPNRGNENLMIIDCSWEQARQHRRQAKARFLAEARAYAQTRKQARTQEGAQAPAPAPAQAQAQVNEGASTSRDNPGPRVEDPVDYRIEPRHHVLYVNVGRHTSTYRFPRDFVAPGFPGVRDLNLQRQHVDSSALVTDFAIRRFGRADGEDVNIIHLGHNGPVVVGGQDTSARPDRSTLRFLSVNGYRNITDRSLTHLATAAPNLEHVDFSDTSVSDAGAETFQSLRPDCQLIYSKFEEKEE